MLKTTLSMLLLLICFSANAQEALVPFRPLNDGNFPKTVAFRNTEFALRGGIFLIDDNNEIIRNEDGRIVKADITLDQFAMDMNRYPVIMGKVVDEERTGNTQNVVAGYTAAKNQHPDNLVFMHFNGRNRRPEYLNENNEPVYPGHWLYRPANTIEETGDISATQTTIRIGDGTHYENENFSDVLAFCLYVEENGVKDFDQSEFVTATGYDSDTGELTVVRGSFGSTARGFENGNVGIAEVALFRERRFFYNYSSICPLDRFGRTANEALIDEMQSLFANELNAFDGVIFDASTVTVLFRNFGGDFDLDLDGTAETDGFKNGVNQMYTGFYELFEGFRAALPDDVILLADSRTSFHNRAFEHLNGTESESWPQGSDQEFLRQWSSGIARHQFLEENLIDSENKLHQFNSSTVFLPPSTIRLIQAAAANVGAAHTAQYYQRESTGEIIGYTDEQCKGDQLDFSGWMGQPVGDMIRLASQQPNLLANEPQSNYTNLNFQTTNETTDTFLPKSRLTVSGIPNQNNEIFFEFRINAQPLVDYEFNRFCRVTVTQSGNNLANQPTVPPDNAGSPLYTQEFHVSPTGNTYGAYFRWLGSDTLTLTFEIEGHEPATVEFITAHDHPDVICREFEFGVAIANPSPDSFDFDLSEHFPGQTFTKINGLVHPDVNDGSAVGSSITIGPLDGIFLIKDITPFSETPNQFTLVRGMQTGGSLADLENSDDSSLSIQPGFVLNSSESPVRLEFDIALPLLPSAVQLEVESQANTTGLEKTISVFNFATNEFDTVATSDESFLTDNVVAVTLNNNVADYIEPGTNDMKVQAAWRQTGFTILFPWNIRIDQVVVSN